MYTPNCHAYFAFGNEYMLQTEKKNWVRFVEEMLLPYQGYMSYAHQNENHSFTMVTSLDSDLSTDHVNNN